MKQLGKVNLLSYDYEVLRSPLIVSQQQFCDGSQFSFWVIDSLKKENERVSLTWRRCRRPRWRRRP